MMGQKDGKNEEKGESGLDRTLTPFSLSLYGLGTILGAGIFVVTGDIVGRSGLMAPLSFLFAALAAGLTALSYIELSTRIPLSGGSAAYVAQAFGRKLVTGFVGWGVIAAGLVSAATIATGFHGYLGVFVDLPKSLVIPAVVIMLTIVAAAGVKQSAWFMGLTTAAGIGGLLMVMVAAGGNLASYPEQLSQMGPISYTGVLLGGFLAFYAYIGFEDIVTLAEETQDVQRTLPIAIFVALGISALFYMLIAATAAVTLPGSELGESRAPLVAVIQAEGWSGNILGGLSLAIIINGALAQIVMAARVVHDLGERRKLAPDWLTRISPRTQTPLFATIAAGAVVLVLALFFPTEVLAGATSFIILGVFAAVNAGLLRLKQKCDEPDRPHRSYPSYVPLAGLVVCILLIGGEAFLGGNGG